MYIFYILCFFLTFCCVERELDTPYSPVILFSATTAWL